MCGWKHERTGATLVTFKFLRPSSMAIWPSGLRRQNQVIGLIWSERARVRISLSSCFCIIRLFLRAAVTGAGTTSAASQLSHQRRCLVGMGIHGLTTYLRENKHILSRTVQVAQTNDPQRIPVVVDAWSSVLPVCLRHMQLNRPPS